MNPFFFGDLVQVDLSDFDIILGMNWLHSYEVKIDCKDLKVMLTMRKVGNYAFISKERRILVLSFLL